MCSWTMSTSIRLCPFVTSADGNVDGRSDVNDDGRHPHVVGELFNVHEWAHCASALYAQKSLLPEYALREWWMAGLPAVRVHSDACATTWAGLGG